MTRFGDSADFAIDITREGEDAFGPVGFFVYWIDNVLVGANEWVTILGDVWTILTPIVNDNGKREACPGFAELTTEELWNTIRAGFYGDDEAQVERANREQWARYKISPEVDVMDDACVYLVNVGLSDRILYRSTPDSKVSEIGLPRGQCDDILLQAWKHLAFVCGRD